MFPDQRGSGRVHNPLNGPNTDSEFTGDLPNTLSCGSLALHCLLYGFRNLGPTQCFPLGLGTFQARSDPLLDHGALEFREYTEHLEKCSSTGCRGVQSLLMKKEVDTGTVKFFEETQEVFQAAAKPVYGPSRHHVEFPPYSGLQHGIEVFPVLPAFGPGNAVVVVDGYDLMTSAFRPPGEFQELVVCGLTVHNRGQRKVKDVGWRLLVWWDGRDANLARKGSYSIMSFITPNKNVHNERRFICLNVPPLNGPRDPSTPVYEIAHQRVWLVE